MSQKPPVKRFFKPPENFAEATDAEIDAFAQSIMDTIFAERDRDAKLDEARD
jgi:hypothetical protein